ncbi:MAG: SRPBCC family protein [Actinomycetota bacterium]
MKLENSFEVPAPIERVWTYMLDVERVVVCMPGAELTDKIDDRHFKGKVNIKLGPVSMSWAGQVAMDEVDDSARTVVLKAKGMEQRGKGSANATVTSTLQPGDGVTKVAIVQDLNIQGQAAQFGRGMLEEVTKKLTRQFADCLKANIGAAENEPATATTGASAAPSAAPVRAQGPPISGVRLGLSALGARITAFFKRLFSRR